MKRIGNHGFTLLELLVVVIIIGVLASVAIPQFGRAIERARIAEANNILGAIATAEALYYQEQNGTAYTSSAGELLVDIPADASTLHFFTYSVVGGTNTFTITATRKTGTAAGKNPSGARAYTVTLNQSGVLNVSGF